DLASTTTTISDSTFSGNRAIGGDGGTGPFVGQGVGGAIANFGPASISASAFDHNEAIAGSGGDSGPGPQACVMAQGAGGAIANVSALDVTSSSFSNNVASGGNNAVAIGTDLVFLGIGYGGAIDNSSGGTATISSCTLDHNQAFGGRGNKGSGAVVLVGAAL